MISGNLRPSPQAVAKSQMIRKWVGRAVGLTGPAPWSKKRANKR